MSIITLTTDFGLKDHFVGALKGKIVSEYPEAQIVDISHHISPFNISEASYIISASYASFPKGTVHLIGIDTERNRETRHLAMQWNDHYFVCADNGILSMLISKIKPQKIVNINIHDRISDTTDMGVFATVASHIAKGGLLNVIGKEITEIRETTELKAVVDEQTNTIKGYIVYIDHFGNAVSNISKKLFFEACKGRKYEIILKSTKLKTILTNYSDIASSDNYPLKNYEGKKLAIFNETGFLEIAIFRSNPQTVGSASSLLGLHYRDVVTIHFL